jgi:dTDP-4-amino-4,6-dideoxygalactose transaminase
LESMYIPAWSPLSPNLFLAKSQAAEVLPYPLAAPHRSRHYAARAGIYALFATLRKHGVDSVLVPDYHGGNEIRAIRAAGMRVVFYSIDHHMNPDLDEIHHLMGDGRVGALYVMHYAGWPQPVEDLATLCRTRGLLMVEDCTHAFLSQLGSKPLGTFGDYSIFSLYKTLPIPNGGVVVRNRTDVPELKTPLLARCSTLSLVSRSSELLFSWIRLRSEHVGGMLFNVKNAVGRGLTKVGIERSPVGSIGFDVNKVDVGMSPFGDYVARRLNYAQIVDRRRQNFLQLLDRLQGVVPFVREDLDEGVCPLFCPILVSDKRATAQALQAAGVEAVEFWNFGDSQAETRIHGAAQFLRRHVLELPIHQAVTPERIDYIADRVRDAVL